MPLEATSAVKESRNVYRLIPSFVLLASIFLVGVGIGFLTGRHFKAIQADNALVTYTEIHSQLKLTADQETKLVPIETDFEEKRFHYVELINQANRALADLLLTDQMDSPRVQVATEEIHIAKGDLEKATLDHLFEIKDILTPEQYQILLFLAADRLRSQP